MRASLVLMVVMVTAACQKIQYRAPEPSTERPPTTVNASFDKTWNAVIDVFANENTPVQTLEKASGFVVAERAVIPYGTASEYAFALALADCGSVRYPQQREWRDFPPTSAKYNIVVRPVGDQATVRVTAKFIYVAAPSTPSLASASRECTSKGVYETATEAAIKRAAEAREPPPSTSPSTTPPPAPAGPVTTAGSPDSRRLNVTIRMRFVDPGSTVTPIPDFDIALIGERGDTVLTRTNASGVANTQLAPGRYRALPRKTAAFEGRIYTWDVAFTVRMGMAPVDLTQRNARAVPVPR